MRIEEAVFGTEGVDTLTSRGALCSLYEKWGQTDKLVACDRQLVAVVEKEFGANDPRMVGVLVGEAKALRGAGKNAEADEVENRVARIRAATMKAN